MYSRAVFGCIAAEQFSDEKLTTELLKIGVKVGNVNSGLFVALNLLAAVGRDEVEAY